MPTPADKLTAPQALRQPPADVPSTTTQPAAVRDHVLAHYRALYRGEKRCRAPILQGRDLAVTLGYPQALNDRIVNELWLNFVPCGNPLPLLAPIASSGIGLNLGCGAGIDALALNLMDGPGPPIVNLDPVTDILQRAAALSVVSGVPVGRLRWCAGTGESLPFRDRSFHWAILNGVFNLFVEKLHLLRELHRVLQIGGRLVICDLFHDGPLPAEFRGEPDAWAWCLGGAVDHKFIGTLLATVAFQLERFEIEETIDRFLRARLSAQALPAP